MRSSTAQKITAKNEKRLFSKQNRSNFVSLRGAQRRGNLKAKGVASRGEAREHETRRNPYHRKTWIRCVSSLLLSLFQGSVSLRSTIFRYGMINRFVKDCRVGRTCPPRNDRIGRLDRKYGTQNPLFGFRKTLLICCLILTVPDFFDSLKRPQGSDESRGRCCLCGKLCPADFRKLTANVFGQSFSRASQPMRSVGASAGLHGRCVRSVFQPVFQPIFQATMESPYLIIS